MADRDLLLAKTNSIQNCLQRIRDVTKGDAKTVIDLNVQDVVVLNLQRAVQLVIDMASYVVTSEQLGLPQTLKETFVILANNRILDRALADKMGRMVGFRNIAVHDYQAIDPQVLEAILTHRLKDLEDFYTALLQRAQ